ncbi:MAG: phosphate starvation-inducible protein PhoH, partial [Brevundimonas sp. 32-68-21]
MARESEFVPLNDAELRAVIGPNSRHVALIEDAFKVLVEAPGGGVSVNGGTRDRSDARQVIEDLAKRAALGAEVTEADVRAALGQARGGKGTPGMAAAGVSLPGGKRGAIVPK